MRCRIAAEKEDKDEVLSKINCLFRDRFWSDYSCGADSCPGVDGAAPFIRMPDALEANIQKATDLGAIGIIVPTVDDALEARDAARFSRYPPFGRRSSGGGSFGQVWPGVNYRATVNDNMLVVVMIETLELSLIH